MLAFYLFNPVKKLHAPVYRLEECNHTQQPLEALFTLSSHSERNWLLHKVQPVGMRNSTEVRDAKKKKTFSF